MSLEALKLIPPTSVNVEVVHGGVPELTGSLVSGAMGMAKLSVNAAYYRQIKYYLDDSKKCQLLENITKHYILPIAVKNKWKCRVDILPKLAETALYESMSCVCPACRGIKSILVNDKMHLCNSCKGTGKHRLPASDISRRLNTDSRNFMRTWKNRYYKILTIFYELDTEIEKSLRKIGN